MKTIENQIKEMSREERKKFLAKSINHELRLWVYDEADQNHLWGQQRLIKELKEKIRILRNMLIMEGKEYYAIHTEMLIFEDMRC